MRAVVQLNDMQAFADVGSTKKCLLPGRCLIIELQDLWLISGVLHTTKIVVIEKVIYNIVYGDIWMVGGADSIKEWLLSRRWSVILTILQTSLV